MYTVRKTNFLYHMDRKKSNNIVKGSYEILLSNFRPLWSLIGHKIPDEIYIILVIKLLWYTAQNYKGACLSLVCNIHKLSKNTSAWKERGSDWTTHNLVSTISLAKNSKKRISETISLCRSTGEIKFSKHYKDKTISAYKTTDIWVSPLHTIKSMMWKLST